MTRSLFGTDGVRGRANASPMTAEIAMRIGMAAGQVFNRGGHRHRVVVGKDTRLSGYMIEQALTAGFLSVGMDVLLLGPLPTPAVGFLTRSMRADVGVMISASHNPYEDNGIKLFGPDGFKLSDAVELEIERLVASPSKIALAAPPEMAAPSAWTMRRVATSRRSNRRPGGALISPGSRSSSTAQTAPPTRSHRQCCGSSAPKSSRSASLPTA